MSKKKKQIYLNLSIMNIIFINTSSVSSCLKTAAAAFLIIAILTSLCFSQDRAKINAEKVTQKNGVITASGNARAELGTRVVTADTITYDTFKEIITAEGNAVVTEPEGSIKANHAIINTATGESSFDRTSGWYYVEDVENPGLKTKVFFWADSITKKGETVLAHKGIISTCDLPLPQLHYHFAFETAEIYPEDEIIINKAKLKLKNTTIFKYNKLRLPLDDKRGLLGRRQKLFPTIGHNTTDGWYIKNELEYELFKNPLFIQTDWYQKTGIGYGFKYPFQFDNGKIWGEIKGYNLSPSSSATVTEDISENQQVRTIGRKEFSGTVNYRFDNGMTVNLTKGFYQYAYVQNPAVKVNATNFSITQTTPGEAYSYIYSKIDLNSYKNESHKADYGIRVSDNWKLRTGVYHSTISNPLTQPQRLTNFYTDAEYSDLYLGGLLSYRHSTNKNVYFMNKEPEASLYSKNLYYNDVPLKAEVTAGRYTEYPSGLSMSRASFYLGVEPYTLDLTSSTKWDFTGGIKQSFLDDTSAKYTLKTETGLTQDFGSAASLGAKWYFQDSKGFSPFLDDYQASYNILTAKAEIAPSDKFKLNIIGGYDYIAKSPTSLIGVLDIKPAERVNWMLGSNYNMDKHNFTSFTSDLSVDLGNGYKFEDWAVYNASTHRLTYHDIGISKDSHDFYTKLIYRSQQKEILFQFYLKAFPENDIYVRPTPERIIVQRRY